VIQPTGDNVLVRPEKGERVLHSGIVVPEINRDRRVCGEVLAVGPGRWEDGVRVPVQVEVGDRVMFGEYAGTEIHQEGEPLFLIHEQSIETVIDRDVEFLVVPVR
jgi:chaperonin GroES